MSILDITKKRFLLITIVGQIHYVLITSIFVLGIRDTIIEYNDIIIDWKDPIFFIPFAGEYTISGRNFPLNTYKGTNSQNE